MKNKKIQKLTRAGIIGALYAGLTMLCSLFGISFGPIQLRVSEALVLLPFLFPEASWGLFVGCFIVNILSPYGLLDMVIGSAATLIAALLTAKCKKIYATPIPPVLINGILVGLLLAYEETNFSASFWTTFWFNFCSVAISEALICFTLGIFLLKKLQSSKFCMKD